MSTEGMPDFFLIGAQKAGTTTLAALLDTAPGVALARPKEPMLFCFDDYAVHRNEFLHPRRKWQEFRWERDRDVLLEAYRRCFAEAGAGDLRGDASTSYALSPLACERIHELCPAARIVMILRDPVARALSSYWHGVRSGVRTRTLEDELRFGSGLLLEFGHYEAQLRCYIGRFGRDRVLVLHFDDLLASPGEVLGRTLTFLGAPLPELPPALPRLNESFYPRFPRLHRRAFAMVRALRDLTPHTALSLPGGGDQPAGGGDPAGQGALSSAMKRLYRKAAMSPRRPPGPSPAVREAMQEHFRRVNAGLSDLLGEDVFARWKW